MFSVVLAKLNKSEKEILTTQLYTEVLICHATQI